MTASGVSVFGRDQLLLSSKLRSGRSPWAAALGSIASLALATAIAQAQPNEGPMEGVEGAAEAGQDPVVEGAPGATAQALTDLSDDTIEALVSAYSAYVRDGNAASALQAAALLREFHEERFGEDSFEALTWLKLHAYSFLRLNDYDNARRTFDRAIKLTERYEGLYSFSLIDLLGSMASTLEYLGEEQAAESALLRAKFLTHRRLGINNLEQVEVLRELSEFYRRNLMSEKAEREQLFMLRINERKYGETPDLVPALYEYANYYLDAGDFQAALPIYRRALAIQEAAYGEDDLRLVDTLRGISLTYRKRNFFRGEGKRALERAVSLYEADELSDAIDHADNLLELGDWHLLSNSSDKAIDAYRRAWQLLADEDGNDERAKALLGAPHRLEYVRPLNVYLDYRQRTFLSAEHFIDVTFTVSAEGKVPKARVIDGTATRRTENETLSAVRAARFRPAFVNGEPVASDLTLRQYFRPR